MNTKIQFSVLLIIGAALSACSSKPGSDVNLDPAAYEYKGAADQLLASPAADRAGGLADRFALVQGRQ